MKLPSHLARKIDEKFPLIAYGICTINARARPRFLSPFREARLMIIFHCTGALKFEESSSVAQLHCRAWGWADAVEPARW